MEMVIIFAGLFITHGICLYAGWSMGKQRDREYIPSVPKSQKSEPYDPVDEIDQERLDWK